MISLKTYERDGERVLAACDQDLLGRLLEEGDLSLYVKEDFYSGRTVTEDEFLQELEQCTIANLVGEKVVDIFMGTSGDCKVLWIDGVPHVQLFTL